jgi:hypothetical protein
MTLYRQSYADRLEAESSAFRVRRRTKTLAAGAVRTLNLTLADALYAYAVTGSAFATLMALAAPHLDVFLRCLFHGNDEPAASHQSALSG